MIDQKKKKNLKKNHIYHDLDQEKKKKKLQNLLS
jgi:hypothetical protein